MTEPTRQQRAILDYLAANSGRWVGGFELRDAVGSKGTEKTIHVQIRNIRRRLAIPIASRRSQRGGYRLCTDQQSKIEGVTS